MNLTQLGKQRVRWGWDRAARFAVWAFGSTLLIAMTLSVPAVCAGQPGVQSDARHRADALLKQMTTEEKIGQMSQLFVVGKPSDSLKSRISKGQIGSALFVTDPVVVNQLQHLAVEGTRLHIPLIFGFDVIHGLRTIFPVALAMAASWDPDQAERAQAIAAQEARSVGIDWTFAPMVDIARDPRWGRIVEGAGEDPFLGSAMAAAQVRGFQGDHIGAEDHILACAKHFAGYGAAVGGRDYEESDISEAQLHNVYLPPFKSAVDAGVGTLMSAYMDLNGVPASGNRWLLHDVLREDWHFEGFVVSDADAVKNLKTHGFAADAADASYRAFNAGVNMEMALGISDYEQYLPSLYKQGKISDRELDDAVRPILEAKIRLGLFEHPYVDETLSKRVLLTPAHKAEALRAAERSAVLLRNEGGLLPLHPGTAKKIAVIGPLGDSKYDIDGPWSFAANANDSVSILEGLKTVAPDVTFEPAPGAQIARMIPSVFDMMSTEKRPQPQTPEDADRQLAAAVQLAKSSDLALLVLGEKQDMAGEAASSSSLELPGEQEKLLEAVVATGKPTVLVLMSARPLDLRWANQHVPAILDVWYPGTEGGLAVANLLYGKAVPGGKLPYTWPQDVGQVPMFYAHTTGHDPLRQGKHYWNESSTPLYPFGYGLSYTDFRFSNLHLDQDRLEKGASLKVSVDVENTGHVAGDEVVQLYLHQQSGTSSRPVRELKAFRRISLAAGERRTVQLTVSADDLSYWSSATKSWVQDASMFDAWIGGDSTANLHGQFAVVMPPGSR